MASESVSSLPGNEEGLADLTVVNYRKLLGKDAAQAALLHSACAEWGFFYLDLGDDTQENYRETVDALFGVAKDYFAKPLKEKLKDTREEISVFNVCGFEAIIAA